MTPAEKIRACWASIGKRPDPMRSVWDSMHPRERRIIATAAKVAGVEARAWDELRAETRGSLARAFDRFRGFVGKFAEVAAV